MSSERTARAWAVAAAATQLLFVVLVLLAPTWQPPGYSSLRHSISDMYAVGSPGAWVMIVVLVAGGLAVTGFAVLSLWPALRPTGGIAILGVLLLALSNYGLPAALAPIDRLPCNAAVPGCSAFVASDGAAQATWHGLVAAVALLFVVLAAAVLAIAMGSRPGWRTTALASGCFALVFLALAVVSGLAAPLGLGGLAERVLAFSGALAIVALTTRTRRALPVTG